ncbi:MAG: TIGR02710 family CRISPR-associated protein [candidate division Zixibacteria bacterium]|nr:TIGR02710 family CRISPR-associated protein [candidate division Zixibacteria bacterium]
MKNNTVLVLTIGGTPKPIIKSLKEHNPGYIYFIPSTVTQDQIPEIKNAVFKNEFHGVEKSFPIKDPADLPKCYRKCIEAFEDIRTTGLESKDIIADPTGGTKIMSAALLLAAIDLGVKVSYVSGEFRTKDGRGIVVDGSEKIVYNSHPYDIIAKTQKERFCEFFNSYRFSPAIDICDDIIAKGGKELQDIFKILKSITTVYQNRDLFKFKNCFHNLNSDINRLRQLYSKYPAEIDKMSGFIKQVSDNIDYLESLKTEDISLPMVEELVANASRRAEEGRFDDAIARLYRALEMVAQAQFYKLYGQGTSNFPFEKLVDELKSKHQCKKKKGEVVDLGCYDAFKQLYKSDDEFGKLYFENEEDIVKILNLRNRSILAHGIDQLDKYKYEKLYSIFSGVFGIDGKIVKFAKMNIDEIAAIGIE